MTPSFRLRLVTEKIEYLNTNSPLLASPIFPSRCVLLLSAYVGSGASTLELYFILSLCVCVGCVDWTGWKCEMRDTRCEKMRKTRKKNLN